MSDGCPDLSHRRTGTYYAAFAYGLVVCTAFASFLSRQITYFASAERVPVVFALGALYVALGILANDYTDQRSTARALGYFGVQCAVVTLLLWLSPVRGFLSIIVMPLASQAVFDLPARYVVIVTAYLFAQCVALFGVPYGWGGAVQAAIDYATAFIFTIVFSIITRRALLARRREEGLRKQVEEANRQLQAQAQQREELATVRERNRVAREIHDGVGHYLTVVKTQLDAAAALLPEHPERARETVQKAARLAAEALDDVRRSVGTLRADAPNRPLEETVRALAAEADFACEVRVEGEPRPLPPAVEHALFRAAQEALTNVRKHARASRAELVLDFRESGSVRLVVNDDGAGGASSGKNGFGLLGMRERVELLGGKVQAGKRASGGFSVVVEVPA